jgi:hypothetical protein
MIKNQQFKKIFASYYGVGVALVFLLISAHTISNHEMWRDEIQAWLLARDSASLFDLFRNLKYEVHPALWYLCLMPLTRIFTSPSAMQVFHLLVATTAIFLFVKYSPFNIVQKILFSFGYFPFYEYSIISRNYALGMLLIFIFCALFPKRYTKFTLIGIVLFLLSQTSLIALILVIVISIFLFIDYKLSQKWIAKDQKIKKQQLWIGFTIIVLGIVISILQLIPPTDSGFAVSGHWMLDLNYLEKTLSTVTQAFFPIPRQELYFWNTIAWRNNNFFPYIINFFTFFFILWFIFGLLKKPATLFLFLGCTLGILLSCFIAKFVGSIRHQGFIFIAFIMSAWIADYSKEVNWFSTSDLLRKIWKKIFSYSLTIILIVHVISAIIAIKMDDQYIFSSGKLVAEYIKSKDMAAMLMVGHTDYATSTVVGYLAKDKIYYPNSERFGSYINWDNKRTSLTNQQVIDRTNILSKQYNADVLIILNSALSQNDIVNYGLVTLKSFTGSIVKDEDYYLYILPFTAKAKNQNMGSGLKL